MWKQRGKAHFNPSSALERAKVQLSGQRITNRTFNHQSPRRDSLNVSLGGARLQSRQTPVQDLDQLFSDTESETHHHVQFLDVAGRSEEPQEQLGSGGGRRFLKRSANIGVPSSTPGDTPHVRSAPNRGAQSRALSRLALIEDRIRNRKPEPETGVGSESGLSGRSRSGGDGSRFVKNKVSSQKSERKPDGPLVSSHVGPVRDASSMKKTVSLDSDEDDMRELLGESPDSRDPEKTPPPSTHSSPEVLSPSRPFSRRAERDHRSPSPASVHSEIRSLEELFPIGSTHDDTQSEFSAQSDDFRLNVMTLDDLAPARPDVPVASKEKTESSPSTPMKVGQTLQDPGRESRDDPAPYPSDFESSIQTESSPSEDGTSDRPQGTGGGRSSPATEPQSSRSSSDEASLSPSTSSETPSYSSDFTASHTEPRRGRKDATVQTQADGLTYTWSSGQAVLGPSLGTSYVDPTPVASHVISAEAVEALSAYSPAALALNDMLRQQLALTRSFIRSSRYLHQTMLESLGAADYRYTTLEDTKKFIRRNRPPKLSVEDALEEVLQEMRDYHYI